MEQSNVSGLRFLTRPSSSSSSSSTVSSSSNIPVHDPLFLSSSSSSTSSTNPISSSSSLNPPYHPTPISLPSRLSSTLSSAPPLPPSSTQVPPSSSQGVVVVGVVGRNSDDVTQLINRILDSNVFGSGSQDKNFSTHVANSKEQEETTSDSMNGSAWFQDRGISYHFDEEKGIVFLQFTSFGYSCLSDLSPEFDPGEASLPSVFEDHDSGDLRGLLLMFSVCHVIIFLQEGSRFDTQLLKKFRILQAAKHALAPFVKSHITPMTTSKNSNMPMLTNAANSLNNSSPGRGVATNRHGSAISLMSGSYPSLFPGQCTPAVLFVFLDDFLDGPTSGSHTEDSTDAPSGINTTNLGTSLNQSSGLITIPRPNLSTKGSSSVVMLSRPTNKTEGGLRKKLQSSLESQIRFLIKKCRTLAGGEGSGSGSGSRTGGSMSGPGIGWTLFSLDASRAVALLDKSNNCKAESLNFVSGLIEDVLNGKAAPDILLLENHSQIPNREDIQSIREFIYRQSETLRGRGGLSTNAPNSGSAQGVGMVAVAAAAAAAASAASGGSGGSAKSFSNPPELPSLEKWLSASRLLLDALVFRAKYGTGDENEGRRELLIRRNATKVGPVVDAVDAAISCLESGRGLNMKFSMSWCQRTLPAANEVYTKGLPPCYSTSVHEAQLEKALRAFHSMVKGPAVEIFSNRLKDGFTSIWKSGRQLCDAVSLTGKPCMHQTHDVAAKPHSSGFYFFHACACGRSRRLREDPFDFDSANARFNCFSSCDTLLPSLLLPDSGDAGPLHASAWSLVRVGGSRYYEPSKGLLQSGFCSVEKFMFKWLIFLEKRKETNGFSSGDSQKISKVGFAEDEELKVIGAAHLTPTRTGEQKNQRKPTENISPDDPKISFGRGFPVLEMKKPFAEVVARSIAADSAFPPLQQRKQSALVPEKGMKQRGVRDRIGDGAQAIAGNHGSLRFGNISVLESGDSVGTADQAGSSPVLQIGSNVVPVNMSGNGKIIKPISSLKHVVVYVGFEHECSYGHRFLLSVEHLSKLASPYSLSGELHKFSCIENFDLKPSELLISGKTGKHEGGVNVDVNKQKSANRSAERTTIHSQHPDGSTLISGKKQDRSSTGFTAPSKSGEALEGSLQNVMHDCGEGFSLLNRNLPIYMNCPHCRISKGKSRKNVKFASMISQLQRIFIVTPPFPTVLATCPVVQFEPSCLLPSVGDREQQSQFSLCCRVILPPESFVSLRLPFVYGVQLDNNNMHSLRPLDHQPELTAWIAKGTTLQVVSRDIDCSANEIK